MVLCDHSSLPGIENLKHDILSASKRQATYSKSEIKIRRGLHGVRQRRMGAGSWVWCVLKRTSREFNWWSILARPGHSSHHNFLFTEKEYVHWERTCNWWTSQLFPRAYRLHVHWERLVAIVDQKSCRVRHHGCNLHYTPNNMLPSSCSIRTTNQFQMPEKRCSKCQKNLEILKSVYVHLRRSHIPFSTG